MRMKRWSVCRSFLVIMAMALLLLSFPNPSLAGDIARIPDEATAKTLDGKTVSLADYKGKLVFLNMWKSDCVPCLLEIPILKRLQREYGADDFTVIGISLDRGKDQVVGQVVDKAEINYPIWLGYDQPILQYVNAPVVPFLFVLGPEGEVLGYVPGKIPSYDEAVSVMNRARLVIGERSRQK
jgi:cytochrome c biogenesis protein CcmG/thiol:disulfide interchange protein DsbE